MSEKAVYIRQQSQSLISTELERLSALVIDLALRLEERDLPGEMQGLPAIFQNPHTPESLLALGDEIRRAHLLYLDAEPSPSHPSFLFWEAIAEGILFLIDERKMHITVIDGDGAHHEPAPPPRPISLSSVIQFLIDSALSDGFSPEPSVERQRAVAQFALTLDPFCVEGYFLQGRVAERAQDYQRARIGYERAMEIGALHLGPAVVTSLRERKKRDVTFWLDLSTRPYMRARNALAFLLWQDLGDLPGALVHFQALLALDPSDHQGNRMALLCLLLELGDDEKLGSELARHRFYPSPTDELEEVSDTFWHYTQACRLYRLAGTAPEDTDAHRRALQALQQAFEENSLVPALLCRKNEPGRTRNKGIDSSAEELEAAEYVSLAKNGWQKTPGALQWMEAAATQAHILPPGK